MHRELCIILLFIASFTFQILICSRIYDITKETKQSMKLLSTKIKRVQEDIREIRSDVLNESGGNKQTTPTR